MRCVTLMFDSLNRHALPPYGHPDWEWLHAPNFKRLAQRGVTFDRSYVCSMPCMPARRDFQTGRPNFLHRSWGPIEPFDDCLPRMLDKAGIHAHMSTDHQHYWEHGGATYHQDFSSYEFIRGQEGDRWKGQVKRTSAQGMRDRNAWGQDGTSAYVPHEQDRINRLFEPTVAEHHQTRTFNSGLDFIDRNADQDNWYCHIETFDPHEPFFAHREFKDLYAEHYDQWQREDGRLWDWPDYRKLNPDETPEQVHHMRVQYAALVSMCDASLGRVMEAFDKHNLWDDTMLILWTDHGFHLGEHDCWAKMHMPWWNTIANTPFFVVDPRYPEAAGQRRSALIQPSIDLAPTILNYFGLEPTEHMTGKDLAPAIADDTAVRDAAIFGGWGGHVNVTDGEHVYMRAAAREDNRPLNEYTLMPTHMKSHFAPDRFEPGKVEMHEGFAFTRGAQVMKITADDRASDTRAAGGMRYGSLLYDLTTDPGQETPIENDPLEAQMQQHLTTLMQQAHAPSEQYERLGLQPPAE